MNIIFTLRDGFTIVEFKLVDNQHPVGMKTNEVVQIKDLVIYHTALAKEILKNPTMPLTYSHLLGLFQYYLGGNGTLEEYIDHIKKNGFFSPYQPNLEIKIS